MRVVFISVAFEDVLRAILRTGFLAEGSGSNMYSFLAYIMWNT